MLLSGGMFLLATVYPATKALSGALSPLEISFFRYGFAVLALLPFYISERRRKPVFLRAQDFWAMSLLGLLGVALFSYCLTTGVKLSSASNGSLLANSQPIFTTLLAPLIIREDFAPLRLVGALAGMAGVALIVSGGRLTGEILRQEYFWGNLILVGGSLAISLYSILLKKYVIRYGGLVPTFLTMLWGSLFLLAAMLASAGWHHLGDLKPGAWLMLIYMGIAGTALVYPLFNAALKASGVVRATGFKLLVPVFAVALSFLLLGERPGWPVLLGAGVVIVSVLLIQRIPTAEGTGTYQ